MRVCGIIVTICFNVNTQIITSSTSSYYGSIDTILPWQKENKNTTKLYKKQNMFLLA